MVAHSSPTSNSAWVSGLEDDLAQIRQFVADLTPKNDDIDASDHYPLPHSGAARRTA